jgi:hypothetical protein
MEAMLVNLLLQGEFKFSLEDCAKSYEQFHKGRYSKAAFAMPPLFELMVQVELANTALVAGRPDDFHRFLTAAIGDTGARSSAQTALLAARDAVVRVDPATIFSFVKAQSPDSASPALEAVEGLPDVLTTEAPAAGAPETNAD